MGFGFKDFIRDFLGGSGGLEDGGCVLVVFALFFFSLTDFRLSPLSPNLATQCSSCTDIIHGLIPDDAETHEGDTGHGGRDDGHHQRGLTQAEEGGQLLCRAGRGLETWVEQMLECQTLQD